MRFLLANLCALALTPLGVQASAYGSLSNFDAVNDTGAETHGFEIEIEDVHSTDILYTYDWNHYGTPSIVEDNSDPAHPKTLVRYQSKQDGAGNYLAYTAVPAGPFPPTQGHQCTNPAVNEGCEHFGVSYSAPGAVRYRWLVDDPVSPGHLVRGPEVMIAAPSWTYQPAAAARPAQVVAAIPAPPVPLPVAKEFGEPSWVKVIKTKRHKTRKVPLNDLVSADNDGDGKADWSNGEVAEVETEWHLLQVNNGKNAGKLKLPGAAEALPKGNEMVTRRYEFYKYAGDPLSRDGENDEAMCDQVANDDLHGVGEVEVTDAFGESYSFDCGQDIVVGDYTGAQMVGFDPVPALGLIEHLADGALNEPYTRRTMVVGGKPPYVAKVTGSLPTGLTLDRATGVLSGTPIEAGVFDFTVDATDKRRHATSRAFSLNIPGCGQTYVRIKSVGRQFLVLNSGLGARDRVWYTPTPAGTVFAGGTTTFLAREYVTFEGTADALGSCHATSMTVYPAASYTVPDSGSGLVTEVGDGFLMAGAKKILWGSNTNYTLRQADAVAVGMNASWRGNLDPATDSVLAFRLSVE
jgi:hypothetical protein